MLGQKLGVKTAMSSCPSVGIGSYKHGAGVFCLGRDETWSVAGMMAGIASSTSCFIFITGQQTGFTMSTLVSHGILVEISPDISCDSLFVISFCQSAECYNSTKTMELPHNLNEAWRNSM